MRKEEESDKITRSGKKMLCRQITNRKNTRITRGQESGKDRQLDDQGRGRAEARCSDQGIGRVSQEADRGQRFFSAHFEVL